MLISIFTPTYNRASFLPRLYKSLLDQKEKDFEWVIVDDGSTDCTENVVKSFIQENRFPILYHKQCNSGKHIAINNGVKIANGELFFIVDSDDYLTDNSTSFIKEKYKKILFNNDIAGIAGRKGYSENEVIGKSILYDNLVANSLDFRYKHKISGDMAEVIKLSILRQYPFPIIEGEKFCTEGLVWSRIAKHYSFVWYPNIIYIAEYLDDGLSASSFRVRKKSPIYATLYYLEHEKMSIPLIQKIKANINYWRFSKYINCSFLSKWKKANTFHSLIGYPTSLIFSFLDK